MSELVWSYSMLSVFEECPLKWYDKYILKNKEPENEAMRKGKFIHSSIENYLKSKAVELPEELLPNKALIDSIKKQFTEQSEAELKMGITKELKSCEFFGNGVWGRGAADVAIIHYNSNHAFLGDWKTGKKKDHDDQIKIQALMLFKHYGKLQTISGCNLWLKDNTMGEVYTFYRMDETKMWVELLQRLQKMYAAVGTPAAVETRPGYMCRFCPVKACKFNKG